MNYSFEFPHEEAHLIPQMFPEAEKYIHPSQSAGYTAGRGSLGFRNDEAREFDRLMDEQERNR